MNIKEAYSKLNAFQKNILHMAFDDGSAELIELEFGSDTIFIAVNFVERPNYIVIESRNHWTVGKVLK